MDWAWIFAAHRMAVPQLLSTGIIRDTFVSYTLPVDVDAWLAP